MTVSFMKSPTRPSNLYKSYTQDFSVKGKIEVKVRKTVRVKFR